MTTNKPTKYRMDSELEDYLAITTRILAATPPCPTKRPADSRGIAKGQA